MPEQITHFLNVVRDLLNITILKFGKGSLTLYSLLYFIITLALLVYISGILKKLLVRKVLVRYNIDIGVRQAFGSIFRYTFVILGIIIIVQTAGVDLSALTIIAGALGVGIGFGLQNITNNFISGIIILFERPIKVGDRIEVGTISGDVISISPRSTTVLTNDNIAVIVPNSEFISSRVINWSYTDRDVRFNFPIGVSYNEDPEHVKRVLIEVIAANKGVLKDPRPDVLFDSYADSALIFVMRVWSQEYTHRPNVLKSQLYYEVFKRFKEEGIKIPYPQRDLHLISGFDGNEKTQPLVAEN
jgi:small-conductance mechanosensitive channel